MNRKLLVTTSLLTVALLVSMSIAAAVFIPADEGSDAPGVSTQPVSTTVEFSAEDLGLTEEEAILFAEGLSELESTDSYLYAYIDENGQINAEVTQTIDSGVNKVEQLWNGWRVYLSSEVIAMIIDGGDFISIVTSFVPGISVLGPGMLQVLRVSIYIAAQNYLGIDLLSDDYGGLYFDVTYKEKKKIFFFTITLTHAPRVTGAGFQ